MFGRSQVMPSVSWTPASSSSAPGSCGSKQETMKLVRRSTRRVRSSGSASQQPRSAKQSGKRSSKSIAEDALLAALVEHNLQHGIEREVKFYDGRKWRFDFGWRARKVAVEVEGGVFVGGRHTRPAGFISDCEKYNSAVLKGWRVLRFVPRKGWLEEAIPVITEALA